MEKAVTKAANVVGGQAELAKRLNISPQAVNKWIKRGLVPPERVLEVERLTNGAVTRYELRPDVFGTAHAIKATATTHSSPQPPL